MAAHVCACLPCQGIDLPDLLGEHHVGVRFPAGVTFRGRCSITLDGVEVQAETFECVAGDDGWVARYRRDVDGLRHICPVCSRSACAELVHGAVTIRTTESV